MKSTITRLTVAAALVIAAMMFSVAPASAHGTGAPIADTGASYADTCDRGTTAVDYSYDVAGTSVKKLVCYGDIGEVFTYVAIDTASVSKRVLTYSGPLGYCTAIEKNVLGQQYSYRIGNCSASLLTPFF